jgi:nucleotide-binding universal stress UspA family protein
VSCEEGCPQDWCSNHCARVPRRQHRQAIIDFAGEKDADAIVVGKQGSGRVANVLLGSVAQKLVNLATCVVMVVP